ncbi:MAG: hypothetical protein J6T74_02575 [Clostridia bacterium]|nr:hypothetical protein [Clostridia bacterium]
MRNEYKSGLEYDYEVKIYRDLLQMNGQFGIKEVYELAFKYCPEDFPETRKKEIGLEVLDFGREIDMIRCVDYDDWRFVSVLTLEDCITR